MRWIAFFLRWVAGLAVAILGSGILAVNLFYLLFAPLTAYLSFFLISLFHRAATLDGMFITVGSQVIELIPACVAASAYLLLALLILLTRGISLKKGLLMFVVGSVFILVANVIRIEVLVALLLTKQVNYFETLHLLFWKILASVYVVGVWIVLCRWFHIKTIPLYSDIIFLCRTASRNK